MSEDTKGLARSVRVAEAAIAERIIASHHEVWPAEVDVTYTVTQRHGKARVLFNPPPVKEKGWVDR